MKIFGTSQVSKKMIFERIPVPKAVAAMAIPTIISQIVAMFYNLADTFFIGQLGDSYMIAAVSMVEPWFTLTMAIGNLFGIGGSSLVSRMLGAGRPEEVKFVSSFCIYGSIAVAALFSGGSWVRIDRLLYLLGASEVSIIYARMYMIYVVCLGGIPTVLSMVLAHFLRGEGYTQYASIGMVFGGMANMALDPLLMFGFKMGFLGAAVATACSNLLSVLFYLVIYYKEKDKLSVSLHPRFFSLRYVWQILSVGMASALASILANVSGMVTVKLASGYGDIAVAAYGITKKIDRIPTYFSLGLCQGMMPLVSYNFASGNHKRMKDISIFSWKVGAAVSLGFITCFFCFPFPIIHLFIHDPQTTELGARLLRIACTAVPLTSVNYLVSYTLQAMGKGVPSALLTISRQAVLLIPSLLILNSFGGLYGMIWAQPIVEMAALPISFSIFHVNLRKLMR